MIAAAMFLLGVVVGITFLAICMAWDRANADLDRLIVDDLDGPDLDANVAFYDSRPWGERR